MIKMLKIFLLLFPLSVFGQIPFSVYLIGDAGDDTIPGQALQILQTQLLTDTNSAVIFLGDNVYPNGLNLKDKNSILHLESQLQILKLYKGQAYFIPGNHDWDGERINGLKKIKDQEHFVTEYLIKNSFVRNRNEATFMPGAGYPGPETVMLNEKIRVIFIDTQWFLHAYRKKTIGSVKYTKRIFYNKLDSLLVFANADHEQVIVVGHHPMFSNGNHSKSLQPFRFLINKTPFRVFGIFGLSRLLSQDLKQPRYRKMQKRMMESFNKYDNIIYASGHEHNLQCFKQGENRYIVSGAGSKISKLRNRKKIAFFFEDDTKHGFVKLKFADRKIQTTIYRVGEKEKVLLDY